MNRKILKTNDEHEKFFEAFTDLLKKFEHMPAEELLALTSNVTGRLCAMQDQRRYTASEVMEMVSQNLQRGNQQMLDMLILETRGNA